jgi:prophage regulatory protein
MQITGRLLPIKAVIEFTSLSRATLYRHIKRGAFPQPIKIGERRVVWRGDDINAWLASCLEN